MPAMQEFLKKAGPVGCGIFLLLMILFFALCFKESGDLLREYTAPEVNWSEDLPGLAEEIRTNVTPILTDITDVSAGAETVTVTIRDDNFFPTRRALLKHFDSSLLELRKESENG